MALRFGLKCIVVAATVAAATAVSIIDAGADPRQEINVTGAAYPDGLRLIELGSKNVTLQDLTIECPGLHISGGQDAAGRLSLVNVTVTCNDAASDNAVVFMDGGPLRGAVVIDNCTVTASNATQPMSDLLQIREAGGRLAIRGGRFALNSTVPTHRCIDFRGVLGGADVTVENVDASVTVDLGRSSTRGTVASALRVHRTFSGSSVSITGGRLVTDVTQEWNAIGVEVYSAAAGSAIVLRDVTADVHGRAAMSALAVLRSSCTVAVDGGRFITNASLGFVDAVYFDDFGGAATITSALLTAIAAGTDRAAALAMTTVSGQVTVVDATLTAAAKNSRVEAVFSQWLSGSSAVLTIRGCTITATGKANLQAVSLQSHSGSSSVTIANSTLSALPDPTSQSASAADALLVKRISRAATVDVIDSHLVARGRSRVSAASLTLGSTGASFSVTRSTLEATTVGGGGAFGINVGHTASALLMSNCTVTARSSDDEAIGVRVYERLTGVLVISQTAFTVSAASAGTDGSGTSGAVISTAAPLSMMDGMGLRIADSTFDGAGSAAPLLFVRLPRRWAGRSAVVFTNVNMTEKFNSAEHGLVSMATNGTAYPVEVAPGSSATRCITDLIVGGTAVVDNFPLPDVPSTVNCRTRPTTPAPVVSPTVPAASSASVSSGSATAGPSSSGAADSPPALSTAATASIAVAAGLAVVVAVAGVV